VVFVGDGGRPWVVSIDGGTPSRIADVNALAPDVSPDGRWLGFISLNAANAYEIVVCDLPACASPRRFAPPGVDGRDTTLRFSPGGAGIAYVNVADQPNIWVQPLDGSEPQPFTQFTDGRRIFDFAWSRDGERLAIARGTLSTDIVLFKGLRLLR